MNRRTFLTFGQSPLGSPALAASLNEPANQTRNADLSERELASRFLSQATLGHNLSQIDELVSVGFESWMDAQFKQPLTNTTQMTKDLLATHWIIEGDVFYDKEHFRYAWWQALMTNPDQLRQKVAYALSQIMVISSRLELLGELGTAIATFNDILLRHAFGNFRDLLYDVSLNPAMGLFLSHAGNQKSDPRINRYPDENYAREVMQLFSIGLFELNNDGSRKKDAQGNDIPTYDNEDIREFAKIFTGLTYADPEWGAVGGVATGPIELYMNSELVLGSSQIPMIMFDQFHEPGEKRLLNGQVVPGGQTGIKDISDAIDNLFNHPNVGPFIGRLLIQRLVTSNPSPAYINRVAHAFNDNGRGVRGDMQAVIKAILLDQEARDPARISDQTHGKLREPFTRYTQLCIALEARNANGENLFFNRGERASESLGQYPFASPSVFNFYMPDYRPLGPLLNADLNGPEFQIFTSVTAIKTYNFWQEIILNDDLMQLPHPEIEENAELKITPPTISPVRLNLDPYLAMEGNVDAVIDRFDLLLTYGSLSDAMRQLIYQSMSAFYSEVGVWDEMVRFGLLMFMTNPDYAVMK